LKIAILAQDASLRPDGSSETILVHSIDLPPVLRESVKRGLPLF
jgi:hypothetical protein